MSDEPFLPMQPSLMSPLRARNLARYYKGFATALRADGYTAEANQAERDSAWCGGGSAFERRPRP